jgi:hypothetical protein
MTLSIKEDGWNIEAVFDQIWCFACGGTDFTLIPGMGVWCDDCNCSASVRYPNGDSGYIVEFTDDGTVWPDQAVQRLPNPVLAKFLGQSDPHLEYIGEPHPMPTAPRKVWEPAAAPTTALGGSRDWTTGPSATSSDTRPTLRATHDGRTLTGNADCSRCGSTEITLESRGEEFTHGRDESLVSCETCGLIHTPVFLESPPAAVQEPRESKSKSA